MFSLSHFRYSIGVVIISSGRVMGSVRGIYELFNVGICLVKNTFFRLGRGGMCERTRNVFDH